MVLLPAIGSFVVLFLTVAALGVALVVGVLGEAVLRNRTRRLRLHQPVRVYYRQALLGH